MLNVNAYKYIERIKNQNGDIVDEMYKKYPFDEYFLPYFRRLCYKYGVGKNTYLYQECFDAGMLAYMHSICRCSIMNDRENADHVKAYIWKIVKIYFIAAMVISDDSRILCKENGFKQVNCNDDYRV